MKPNLKSIHAPQRFSPTLLQSGSSLNQAQSPTKPYSRVAAYGVFFGTVFASMAAAATVANSELPLILGGL